MQICTVFETLIQNFLQFSGVSNIVISSKTIEQSIKLLLLSFTPSGLLIKSAFFFHSIKSNFHVFSSIVLGIFWLNRFIHHELTLKIALSLFSLLLQCTHHRLWSWINFSANIYIDLNHLIFQQKQISTQLFWKFCYIFVDLWNTLSLPPTPLQDNRMRKASMVAYNTVDKVIDIR